MDNYDLVDCGNVGEDPTRAMAAGSCAGSDPTMFGPLVQLLLLVGMTHGVRSLGRRVGPRRGGLLMGVPSTTALVLVGCGMERGLDEATLASESCLAGLVAAAVLPLAYARATVAGCRTSVAAALAVAGYAAVAAGLWWLPGLGAVGCAVVSGVGVILACHLARQSHRIESGRGSAEPPGTPNLHVLACRTALPAGYFLTLRLLRSMAGSAGAGRFITFPSASLAVLVTTHIEAGPATACRVASAMPAGNLGMLAFLTAFRFGCPAVGLAWGTAIGFAAALATLAVIGSRFEPKAPTITVPASRGKTPAAKPRVTTRPTRNRTTPRRRARAAGRRRRATKRGRVAVSRSR